MTTIIGIAAFCTVIGAIFSMDYIIAYTRQYGLMWGCFGAMAALFVFWLVVIVVVGFALGGAVIVVEVLR